MPIQLMEKCQSVVGFLLTEVLRTPELYASSLKEVLGLVASGRLKPYIGGVHPLEDAAKVQQAMESRQTIGKLILAP